MRESLYTVDDPRPNALAPATCIKGVIKAYNTDNPTITMLSQMSQLRWWGCRCCRF